MLVCQVFCDGSKSRFLHCLYYSLPSAREGPCSCLVGGPPAQQVQHAVVWSATFTSLNALHGLVVHTQEGTKVPPFCIQLVVESFNNVCRQRRGGKDVVLLCCEANCSSTTDSPAVLGGGGVGAGRGVRAPKSGNTESGWLVVCREEGEERHENGLHPGHIPFT